MIQKKHVTIDCPNFCQGKQDWIPLGCILCENDCRCPDCSFCEDVCGEHIAKTLTEDEINNDLCYICFPHTQCIDCPRCGEEKTCIECDGCAGCEP